MTLESQSGICLTHPTAVVDNLQACTAGINSYYVDAVSTGVNGVLHQFLDHGGRSLDYFACCYLIGY